jgi:hypothetical protein
VHNLQGHDPTPTTPATWKNRGDEPADQQEGRTEAAELPTTEEEKSRMGHQKSSQHDIMHKLKRMEMNTQTLDHPYGVR